MLEQCGVVPQEVHLADSALESPHPSIEKSGEMIHTRTHACTDTHRHKHTAHSNSGKGGNSTPL